jgi:1-acyl-sn-glycerol-3-phosphate acyltransferase
MSGHRVELGLVPFGSIGLTLFAFDLWLASRNLSATRLAGLDVFFAERAHWRVAADLVLIGLFGGFYIVPLYALIQERSAPSHRSRIIAANNILNALFMIVSAGMAAVLLKSGVSVPQLFLITGLLNLAVAVTIFLLVPEYLLRFVAWVSARFVYRFRVRGDEHIPTEGAAILVCNHVSFVDAILLMAASPRPIVFIMDHRIFRIPLLGWLFRLAKAIPIAPQKEDPQAYAQAFVRARQVLAGGDLLGIFPEGAITRDGRLGEFRGGVMKLLESNPVPVIPLALQNLWGSFFSRIEGGAMTRPFRRGVFSRVGVVAGEAIAPTSVTPAALRERVGLLLAS